VWALVCGSRSSVKAAASGLETLPLTGREDGSFAPCAYLDEALSVAPECALALPVSFIVVAVVVFVIAGACGSPHGECIASSEGKVSPGTEAPRTPEGDFVTCPAEPKVAAAAAAPAVVETARTSHSRCWRRSRACSDAASRSHSSFSRTWASETHSFVHGHALLGVFHLHHPSMTRPST